MKNKILGACFVLLMSTLTAGVAFATQSTISVTGGGTLTYTYTNSTGACEGRNGRSMIYYDITYFSGFSYKNTAGTVTQFPGSSVETVANSGCGPSQLPPIRSFLLPR
jgi:hypothetical protein